MRTLAMDSSHCSATARSRSRSWFMRTGRNTRFPSARKNRTGAGITGTLSFSPGNSAPRFHSFASPPPPAPDVPALTKKGNLSRFENVEMSRTVQPVVHCKLFFTHRCVYAQRDGKIYLSVIHYSSGTRPATGTYISGTRGDPYRYRSHCSVLHRCDRD